jgi:hypothetical protein
MTKGPAGKRTIPLFAAEQSLCLCDRVTGCCGASGFVVFLQRDVLAGSTLAGTFFRQIVGCQLAHIA